MRAHQDRCIPVKTLIIFTRFRLWPDVYEFTGRSIDKVDRPGTFCTGGDLPLVMPGLEVDGLGPIRLPLGKTQARKLIKLCRQAPYGKGTEGRETGEGSSTPAAGERSTGAGAVSYRRAVAQ